VIDDNVHLQNTMQLVYELQKAGKQFDLMLYPTARHGVTNPVQVKTYAADDDRFYTQKFVRILELKFQITNYECQKIFLNS
jgi:hypothetical protein